MSKVLRVGITDEEWLELQPLLTHYGELSFILRQAIKAYIKSKREENHAPSGYSKGRGPKSA